MPLIYKTTYYPWITQHVDAKVIHSNILILCKKTEEQLCAITGDTVKIELLQPIDVPLQMKSIVAGDCQIAFMNPLGFAFANQMNTNVKACSVVERRIDGSWGTTYYAQVYANKKTGIKADLFSKNKSDYTRILKGKSIAFGSPFSTSNFIIPAFELKQKGIKLLTAFNRIEFLGGHDLAAKAVYDNKSDLGAGHDGAIIDLANQYGYGDADEKLVRILKADIPSDPVAVNVNSATEFSNLQMALEQASKTPEGEEAIKNFWGGARHLLPVQSDVYKYLIDAAKELNLSREDIFGF